MMCVNYVPQHLREPEVYKEYSQQFEMEDKTTRTKASKVSVFPCLFPVG